MLLLSSKLNFNMAYIFRNGFIPKYYGNALFYSLWNFVGIYQEFCHVNRLCNQGGGWEDVFEMDKNIKLLSLYDNSKVKNK